MNLSKSIQPNLSDIFNQSPDKILIIGTNYELLYFNPTSEQFSFVLGLDKLELGMKFIPKIGTTALLKKIDQAFKGETIEYKQPYLIGDNKHTDIVKIYPTKDKNKTITSVVFQSTPFESKPYVQKELLEYEKLFTTVFENSPFGVTIRIFETQELKAFNLKTCEMFEYSSDELYKVDRKKIIYHEDDKAIKKQMKLMANGKIKSFRVEKKYKTKNGKIFWGAATRSLVRMGNINYQIGFIEDITNQKNNKEKLEKREVQLLKAQELAKLGFWEFDMVTEKFKWSDSIYKMLEIPLIEDPLSSKDLTKMLHPDDVYIFYKALKCIAKKESYDIKSRIVTKKGNIIYGRGIGEPYIENGKVTKIFGTMQDVTEESQIKNNLIESEGKLRAILNSTNDKIYAIDKEYKLLDFNKEAFKKLPQLFQMDKLEIGKVMLAQKESLRELWIGHYNEALAGKTLHLEKKYIDDDVKKTDIVTLSPMKDNKGEIFGVTLYGKDITDLQNAQKAVEETKVQLEDAQKLGKIGNWKYEPILQRIQWSDSIYYMYDFKLNDPSPSIKDLMNFVHPEDLPLLLEKIYAAIRTGVKLDHTARMITKKSRPIYVRCKGIPTLDENNQLVTFEGTLNDVTKLKNIEEDFETTNKKYKDLFKNISDAIVIINNEGKIVESNPVAQKLLGHPKKELRELTISDIVHPDDMEKSKMYLQKLIKDGFYKDYKGRIITKNGEVKYLQINSTAIYENGKMVGSRDILRDLSDITIAEQKKEELLNELAEVNKELKDFAYIVSHDLKAPLRAIKSLSSWLSEDYKDVLDEKGKEQLELLSNRVNRMHEFINGIFEYTKLGRVKEKKEIVSLMEITNNVITTLDFHEKVELKIMKPLPDVYGEKIKLEQVFQNIISNAVKYNDKKRCKIKIDYEDKDSHFVFFIKDNGKGIDKKNYERIFQIFQTLQPKDDFDSTGIGLSIVKRVIQLHGGEIKVHSELDKGSTFEFSLRK